MCIHRPVRMLLLFRTPSLMISCGCCLSALSSAAAAAASYHGERSCLHELPATVCPDQGTAQSTALSWIVSYPVPLFSARWVWNARSGHCQSISGWLVQTQRALLWSDQRALTSSIGHVLRQELGLCFSDTFVGYMAIVSHTLHFPDRGTTDQ